MPRGRPLGDPCMRASRPTVLDRLRYQPTNF